MSVRDSWRQDGLVLVGFVGFASVVFGSSSISWLRAGLEVEVDGKYSTLTELIETSGCNNLSVFCCSTLLGVSTLIR